MTNIKNIVDLWNQEKPQYDLLGKVVCDFIRSRITEYEILPEIQFRTKELLSIIKKIKKKQSTKHYDYQELKDKLGLRIICAFQEEKDIIDTFLKEYFIIIGVEYKQDNLEFNKLEYVSNHYDVKINTNLKEFSKHLILKDYIFEIQVRTLNQHAWSNTAHTLSYKQEKDLPSNLKRKVYRLLSLYELADDEFSSVNRALKETRNNYSYTLLRKLEGKFYKFAKIDFDREISLNSIDIILSYISNEEKIIQLINEIENFINKNEKKILSIYNENRNRYHDILFLTQPEIFIIWFMLQINPFCIHDNWANDFEAEDLELIQTLWGNFL